MSLDLQCQWHPHVCPQSLGGFCPLQRWQHLHLWTCNKVDYRLGRIACRREWTAKYKSELAKKLKSICMWRPTWWDIKHDNGPISANMPTLLICLTTASRTSPLNGRKTIALYLTGYTTNPWPGCITPEPIWSIVVTAITKPYLPVQVPSTSE